MVREHRRGASGQQWTEGRVDFAKGMTQADITEQLAGECDVADTGQKTKRFKREGGLGSPLASPAEPHGRSKVGWEGAQ